MQSQPVLGIIPPPALFDPPPAPNYDLLVNRTDPLLTLGEAYYVQRHLFLCRAHLEGGP